MWDLGIAGKTAIITGGSRGIGRACAMALAAEGVNVVLTARRANLLEETAAEIRRQSKVEVMTVPADMTALEDIQGLVSSVTSRFGGVDILVNNAASFPYGNAMQLTDDEWMGHFQVKAFGYLRTMREVLPIMQQQQWGRVINVAGIAARSGGGSSGANNAAIVNMTKSFANLYSKDGITLNSVHPGGPADSDREQLKIEFMAREEGISIEEATRRVAADVTPIGRKIVSADPARAVVFFASEQAGAITGQVLNVDGGSNGSVVY